MTRLKATIKAVEELKPIAEKLLNAPDVSVLSLYREFQSFNQQLNVLLPIIAKLRVQSNYPSDQAIFGPTTLQTIQDVISKYDHLYKMHVEYICQRFIGYSDYESYSESSDSNNAQDNSLVAETVLHLEKIELAKKQLEQQKGFDLKLDFSAFLEHYEGSFDLLSKVKDVYLNNPANDLVSILLSLNNTNPDEFLGVITCVFNLANEIGRRPDEIALRLLRVNNKRLHEDILQFEGGICMLKFLGFILVYSDEIEDLLEQVGLKKCDEYFLLLNEPDMFIDYPIWKKWLETITRFCKLLKSIKIHYKTLFIESNNSHEMITKLVEEAQLNTNNNKHGET